MAANSLYPSFGVIEYNSPFGAHKMTIPTRAWDIGIGTHGFGGYLGWDGTTPNEADDMWQELIDDLKVFLKADSSFNTVTIYTKADAEAPSIPVTVFSPATVGTNVATTQRKAVSQTWNFRTSTFGKFKLVLLDGPIGSDFDKILPSSFGSEDNAVVGTLTDLTNAWSGRDGAPPAAAISKTLTLNDKLRREYGMA